MLRFVRAALVVAVVSTSFSLVAASPAPATSSAVTGAIAWLRTQQQADGGFEVAGFPGFETTGSPRSDEVPPLGKGGARSPRIVGEDRDCTSRSVIVLKRNDG